MGLRDAGDPVELASIYNRDGADELVFLDITASSDHRDTMVHVVEETARQVFIPLTVGGGIRSIADARKILTVGADKVSINTAAVERPRADQRAFSGVRRAGDGAGRRCPPPISGQLERLHLWRTQRTPASMRSSGLAGRRRWAAGEILLTSMDRDGTQAGFDCDLTRTFSRNTHIPIIASGGGGKPEDFVRVLTDGEADAALRRLDLSLRNLHC